MSMRFFWFKHSEVTFQSLIRQAIELTWRENTVNCDADSLEEALRITNRRQRKEDELKADECIAESPWIKPGRSDFLPEAVIIQREDECGLGPWLDKKLHDGFNCPVTRVIRRMIPEEEVSHLFMGHDYIVHLELAGNRHFMAELRQEDRERVYQFDWRAVSLVGHRITLAWKELVPANAGTPWKLTRA